MSDLIRRSDAIEAITDISKNYTGKGKRNYHPHIDFLVDALKYDVPTIEPKRERCEYCKDGSFIGQKKMLGNDGTWHRILFCPNCGARMKGADDE